MISRIPNGFWAIVALVVWGLGLTALIERGPYGLDEATARAVLFLWSISDQVASPIVTMGIPDFRAVYLIPAGVLFSGSLLAAKIAALLVIVACAIGLYRWRVRAGDTEAPLLASGLLLLSPLAVESVDQISIGPFLLLTFLFGAVAEEHYRVTRIRFGGAYFFQMLLGIAAVSLHPAGLAYPLLLAVSWLRAPAPEPQVAAIIPGRERTHVLAGVGFATGIGLLIAAGWPHQAWFGNPLTSLTQNIFAFLPESALGEACSWALGIVLAAALAAVLWKLRTALRTDRLALTLALATAIAAFAGDRCFATLVLVLLLYWGFPLLLRAHIGGLGGFLGQRGIAFVVLMVASTAFLSEDRSHYERSRQAPRLSAQDQLISALVGSLQESHPPTAQPGLESPEQKARSGPRVASQWPGRTMIACRCGTLPLPPDTEDQAIFLSNLRGIDYVVFDPKDPDNRGLSRGFALLGGESAETVALLPGGVLLRLHPGGGNKPQQPSGEVKG